jgi:hypothetical protein
VVQGSHEAIFVLAPLLLLLNQDPLLFRGMGDRQRYAPVAAAISGYLTIVSALELYDRTFVGTKNLFNAHEKNAFFFVKNLLALLMTLPNHVNFVRVRPRPVQDFRICKWRSAFFAHRKQFLPTTCVHVWERGCDRAHTCVRVCVSASVRACVCVCACVQRSRHAEHGARGALVCAFMCAYARACMRLCVRAGRGSCGAICVYVRVLPCACNWHAHPYFFLYNPCVNPTCARPFPRLPIVLLMDGVSRGYLVLASA